MGRNLPFMDSLERVIVLWMFMRMDIQQDRTFWTGRPPKIKDQNICTNNIMTNWEPTALDWNVLRDYRQKVGSLSVPEDQDHQM